MMGRGAYYQVPGDGHGDQQFRIRPFGSQPREPEADGRLLKGRLLRGRCPGGCHPSPEPVSIPNTPYSILDTLFIGSLASVASFPLNPLVPEHTKVMGKEWAEARRAANVARLRATLATALAGRTGITFELGCGHGLPGILCLLGGASVHFQDFNRQVLTHLTLPNVAANLAA